MSRSAVGSLGLAILVSWTGPALAFNGPSDPEPVDASSGALNWLSRPGLIDRSRLNDDLGDPHGAAVVECVINKHGNPADCVVVSETPPGRNVARMVIQTAELYRAASTDSQGQPVLGRRVRYGFATGGASMIDRHPRE